MYVIWNFFQNYPVAGAICFLVLLGLITGAFGAPGEIIDNVRGFFEGLIALVSLSFRLIGWLLLIVIILAMLGVFNTPPQ
jgi:hypothetical protein